VVCPDIHNVDNIGSLIRISAGFGVDAMILGERCHDPFFRQSVRVSMGAVFKLPIVQSIDIHADLQTLKSAGIQLVATVLDEDAEPLVSATRADRVAILFGNEAQGIERSLIDLCDRRVTIPMKLGTDSLNVSVAAGIFLYHFTR
jgi:tRNA G18 (ribose-2'-O)-methylase SpoU